MFLNPEAMKEVEENLSSIKLSESQGWVGAEKDAPERIKELTPDGSSEDDSGE
jgi:hypothetical protein